MKKLVRIIKNSQRIVIATHIDPDCDGISAAIACAHLVKHYRKMPILFCPSSIPEKYHFLSGTWKFTKIITDFDLLIVVDSPMISRILPDRASGDLTAKKIINIDHHRSNDAFGNLQIIDGTASSSCEIVYRIFKQLHIRISKSLAEILYCGIYGDTGGFVYPNTTKESLRVAGELVALGVKPNPLVKKLNAKTLVGTLLLSQVLNTIAIKGVVGYMYITQNMLKKNHARMFDSENFISFLQAIDGVRVSIFLREEEDGTRVSLRSDGIIDVDEVAREYGGGGHRLAAGIRMKKNMATAKKEVLRTVLRKLQKGT